MDREQWLRERMTGLGGSDAAAVLGLSPWKSPLALYLEKRGELAPGEDSEPMRWGRLLEPVVRQEYAERSGQVVRLPDTILRHPQHPWMLATVDGVTDSGRLVEIKTARSAEGWGEPGTDEIPENYVLQIQHYLAVTALPVADVVVLIAGQDFRLYEVGADTELQDLVIAEEAAFWRRVVEATPPDPVSLADIVARYGRASRAGNVAATDEVLEAIAALRLLKTEAAELEMDEERARAIVLTAFGEFDTLVDREGNAVATWRKARDASVFDSARFIIDHPDLAAQYRLARPGVRRLLLK